MKWTGDPTPAGVVIYDEHWNRFWWYKNGTSGGTLSVKPAVNVTHTYKAYVASTVPSPGPATGVLASSKAVKVSNVGFVGTVNLSASQPTVTADNPIQALSLSSSPGVESPYQLSVYDDLGTRIYVTGSGTHTGSLSVAPPIGATRTYTAYMAQDAPTTGKPVVDVKATSSTMVTNLGYVGTITLSTNRSQLDSNATTATLSVSTSAPVGQGLSMSIYDNLGNRIYTAGFGTSSGSMTVYVPANSTRTYTAYISQTAPLQGPPSSSFAVSNGVYVTAIPPADNLVGLSVPLLEAGAAVRYGNDLSEMCVLAGEVYPAHTNPSSEPDATVACQAGGMRGVINYLLPLIGAAGTATIAWQLVYGGDPAVPSGGTTLLPPPAPADSTQDAPLVEQLTDTLAWRLTNTGTGPATTRHPDEAGVRRIAAACLEQARAGGASAYDCSRETIFVPGTDAGGAAQNDLAAITSGHPWRLHYVSGANQGGLSRDWYNSGTMCAETPPEGSQCDEYPFYSTNEAGPPNPLNPAGARLAWVLAAENRAEAPALNWMPTHCNFTSGVTPGNVMGTHYLVVPLPGVVPTTTYICGDDVGTS